MLRAEGWKHGSRSTATIHRHKHPHAVLERKRDTTNASCWPDGYMMIGRRGSVMLGVNRHCAGVAHDIWLSRPRGGQGDRGGGGHTGSIVRSADGFVG